MSILIYILVAGLVARWVITAWQGSGDGYELASRDAQIKRLREEMDGLHAEVRRLAEEQSFMVRLLSEGDKPAQSAALPAPERPLQSNPEMP
jgi:cell division protein FtsB